MQERRGRRSDAKSILSIPSIEDKEKEKRKETASLWKVQSALTVTIDHICRK